MLYCDRCKNGRPSTKKKVGTCSLCNCILECNDQLNLVELLKMVRPALDNLWMKGLTKTETTKSGTIHTSYATLDEKNRPMLNLHTSTKLDIPDVIEGVQINQVIEDPRPAMSELVEFKPGIFINKDSNL